MLDDRYYMRSPSFQSQRSATVLLVLVNVAVFVVAYLLESFGAFPVDKYFALSTQGLKSGFIWQFVTYQFLHAGILHLVFNLLVIYFFGRAVEETLGKREFLKLYFSSGMVGGLLQIGMAFAFPAYFGNGVVGASAAGFGLVAAFATLFPERVLTLLLFLILPISMRAKTLLWISTGLALFGIVTAFSNRPLDNVAHAAHLGGILAGVAFIRILVQGRWKLPRFAKKPRLRRELVPASKKAFWSAAKPEETEDLPPAEFISREVDPILDKISAHGIHSLTDREKKILEAARAKMAKR